MQRLGWFELPQGFIKREPKIARKIMGECIIVRAEARYDRKVIEYIALSDKFDETPVGILTPKYIIKITGLKKGVRIDWTKENT